MTDTEKAILRFLLADDKPDVLLQGREEMRAACLEWLDANGGDRDRAECELASQLHDDIAGNYFCGEAAGPDERLGNALIAEAVRHVNWRRLARALFVRLVPIIRRPIMGPSVN